MKRTNSSIKNLIVAFGGQFAGIIISFIARLVFIRILTKEYLGLNGLFSNILSILSLVELGIGPAMTYSLYKPLAEKNIEKLKSLMRLYKKMYIIIGSVILVLGILLTPFLKYFIDEMPNTKENISYIYILFVVNTAISYFYTYKRSLIISDQKRYLATLYRYGFYLLLNITQIIILIITKNYILFLVAQIIFTFLENFFLSIKADKLYPFLKQKNIKKLEKKETDSIKKNVTAMVAHKVGGVIVNSTDNLFISKFVGIAAVGMYSNYYLITNALTTVIAQVFSSIVASVGNLCVTADKKKQNDIFSKVFFINFWIYGFASICLYVLFNSFIKIWVGSDYLFTMTTVSIIVINFYLTGMRKTVLTFRDAMGLYWYDRFKPALEVILNIVASIILAKFMGVTGIFIGTAISTIFSCFWLEPYILYKYGLKENVRYYFVEYAKYLVLTIIAGIATYIVVNLIKGDNLSCFIIKAIICTIIPNLIFVLFTFKTKEFKYYKDLVKNIFNKKLKKNRREK